MTKTQRHRRPLQFSLRILLLLVAALCIWLGLHVDRARQQQQAVTALRQMGYTVLFETDYDGTIDPSDALILTWRKAAPLNSWRSAVDRDLFDRAVIVYVDSTTISAALPHLKRLPHLREVSVGSGSCISGRTNESMALERRQLNQLLRDLPDIEVSSWWLKVVG